MRRGVFKNIEPLSLDDYVYSEANTSVYAYNYNSTMASPDLFANIDKILLNSGTTGLPIVVYEVN